MAGVPKLDPVIHDVIPEHFDNTGFDLIRARAHPDSIIAQKLSNEGMVDGLCMQSLVSCVPMLQDFSIC